jgi:DNA-nicking Smr family endonuclease
VNRRRLEGQDLELWHRVTEDVQRLHPDRANTALPAEWLPAAVGPKAPPSRPAIPAFDIGTKANPVLAHDLLPPVESRIANAPVRMDAKAFRRLKRGKLDPESRIDLHGMTLDRAHPVLVTFILSAQTQGLRLVLVITGKGKDRDEGGPIPVRRGVLRHQVPQWLALPPCAQAVLQVVQAHVGHGGGGAYYVWLRKRR